jgi:hypothetical protein
MIGMMGWFRVAAVAVVACGWGCGGANGGGGAGTAVLSQNDGGTSMDGAGAFSDEGSTAHDAGAMAARAPEAGIDARPAATWTTIYQTLLVNQSDPSNCMGAGCHDPGKEKGIDLSTSQTGYTTISARLVPGSPDSSKLVTVLQSGDMPAGRPHMPAANIDLIRAWIQTGALDD